MEKNKENQKDIDVGNAGESHTKDADLADTEEILQETSDEEPTSKNDKKANGTSFTLSASAVLILFVIALFIICLSYFRSGDVEIFVVPEWSESRDQGPLKNNFNDNGSKEGSWNVKGFVSLRNEAVSNAKVRILVMNKRGNPIKYDLSKTGEDGDFNININSKKNDVDSMTIYANTPRTWKTGFTSKQGEIVISTGENPVRQLIGINVWGILILIIFAFGIIIGFISQVYASRLWLWYYIAISIAITISVLMVLYVGSGVQIIGLYGESKILKLGFATIFKETYVKELPSEWIFSMTSPPTDPDKILESPTRGLGAPLWVIFLSVIGSALFTLSLIIKEVRDPASFGNDKDVRHRIHKFIQHQFFILFSPLGGIFLYQTLVVANAASVPLTVAIAALGAGLTLNVLLARAVSASEKWLSKSPPGKTSD